MIFCYYMLFSNIRNLFSYIRKWMSNIKKWIFLTLENEFLILENTDFCPQWLAIVALLDQDPHQPVTGNGILKFKRTDSTMMDIHRPLITRGETRCSEEVTISCSAKTRPVYIFGCLIWHFWCITSTFKLLCLA